MGEQAWGALSNCTKPSSGSYFAATQPLELAHCPNFERMIDVIENVVQSGTIETTVVINPADDFRVQPTGQRINVEEHVRPEPPRPPDNLA